MPAPRSTAARAEAKRKAKRTLIQFALALPLTAIVAIFVSDPRWLMAAQGLAQAVMTAVQNFVEEMGWLKPSFTTPDTDSGLPGA